jgi:hypothetical protein
MTLIASKEVSRNQNDATSEVDFDALPLYPLTFVVQSYWSNNPFNKTNAPAILSSATVAATLIPNTSTPLQFQLVSDTARIAIADNKGNVLSEADLSTDNGCGVQLNAICFNEAGEVILNAQEEFVWIANDPHVAILTGSIVKPVGSGKAVVVVSELGSPLGGGASGSLPIVVTAPPPPTPEPSGMPDQGAGGGVTGPCTY